MHACIYARQSVIEPFKDKNLKLVRTIYKIIKSQSYWKAKKSGETIADSLIKGGKSSVNALCHICRES